MTTTEPINIVVASNNFYAILLGALVKSIELTHKTAEKIDLYIIDDGISKESRENIRASASEEVIRMKWFKSASVIPDNLVKVPSDKSAMPMTTYLRIFAPYILPEGTKRYIYLDVDMILQEDISKLWNSDLGDNMVGAVQDISKTVSNSWAGIPNYKELGMPPETKYFNAGLLVVDQEKWLKEDMTNQVIQCLYDNGPYVNLADQYGLNVVLYQKWKELDPRWNTFANDVIEVPDPFLIHFLDIKPIYRAYNGNKRFGDEFYKCLKLTPWKNHKPIPEYVRISRKTFSKMKKIFFSYLK
ncbi:General stress protein A [Dyadobacter sp. CECT 9275]|uniref:General stress protein A n=1 Tax=Dyadobacter helix TaxID=2822344 RepID=A0A916JB25_9BACT|nr:glycosyltransferase family 8 protein [Dyadobacter sp. CECT 9275]CAG4998975.1 General stress protein A [Dyadobacter sp. CECT 9275]